MYLRETKKEDLEDLMAMWNDGEVMANVGYPQGLGYTMDKMQSWFNWVQEKEDTKHYAIFDSDFDFAGEAFYSYDANHALASLDIKLISKARGKGLAMSALMHAIDALFHETKAQRAYVDPHPDNQKAFALYHRLGFENQPRPAHLEPHATYLEMNKADWCKGKDQRISLREVTKDNFRAICWLQVNDTQKNFVATNAYSLAQSKYEPENIPLAIYFGDFPIGFMMYCIDQDDSEYWIYRMMVDKRYQGRGYGRIAFGQLLDHIIKDRTHHLIRISFEVNNEAAKNLYMSFGFINTNRFSGDEIIYELKY